jgi:hypothetical protein
LPNEPGTQILLDLLGPEQYDALVIS